MLTPLMEDEAQSVVDRIVRELERTYGDDLLYVAAMGSLARGTFSPFSDIDLVALIESERRASHRWLYKTTPVDVAVLPLQKAKKRILEVDGLWPHEVGSFLLNRVYLDRGDVRAKLDRWHAKILREGSTFRGACEILGFFEYFSKVQRAQEQGNAEILRYAAWEIFFMSCMNVALLNKRYFYDHTTMTNQMTGFDFLPPGVLEASQDVFHTSLESVARGARRLFEINLSLADEYGFAQGVIDDVEQLRIG